jgi:DNA-binding MarR family transcriptional regulator
MNKDIDITDLNKLFDNRIRLGIMSALMANDRPSFNELKELLAITDGNLASHLKPLETAGLIMVNKGFLGKKTLTTYSITVLGEKLFREHIKALENLINKLK